jgi:hypothetical protein
MRASLVAWLDAISAAVNEQLDPAKPASHKQLAAQEASPLRHVDTFNPVYTL